MAIRPDVIISAGKIDTSDNAYPYGKAQNRSAPGAGDGTNLEEDWVNDLWGFQQALLEEVGATPSGNPDKVGASQYLDATKTLADRAQDERGVLNWGKAAAVLPSSAFCRGGCWSNSAKVWVVAGNTDGCSASFDDGRTWSDFATGMASAVALNSVAITADGFGYAVGDSDTYYRTTDAGFAGTIGSNWANLTMPGSPTALATIKAWDLQDTLIVVGEKAGPQPYVARAASTAGTFTEKTAPASFSGKRLGSLAIGPTNKAVFAAQSAHTKLARTADAGLTWSDSTTTLNSGIYQVTWNAARALFYAIRTDSTTNNYVYSSPDGDVWTLVHAAGGVGPNSDIGGTAFHGFESYGAALVVSGVRDSALVGISVSVDGGATWKMHLFDAGSGSVVLVGDPTGTMVLACQNADTMYYALRRAAAV